ncbi:HRDC domain-containing protein [Spongisporangium articulatum]|uniref:HRDC domain-containing protein n=1 Tax=Spongisporangium articulatum TaxID=3362603 RepID=A0ABW8ASZ3_9ACTN
MDGTEHVPEAKPEAEPEPAPEPEAPVVHRLDTPRDGVPPVTADRASYEAAVEALRNGTGPVAVDAERASGHRYGQRAFLVQLRREGAGTVLIDPVALPDLSELNDALEGVEWILHAASQDLPCLAEVGMRPSSLFDTELGGRIAGFPRVGLAAMVESLLGLSLAKEHSAVDWSTRPLPEPWLRYAALDVEVLDDLRAKVLEELDRQGKLEWAREEFAAVAAAPPPPPRIDPWRRTSGMHRVRDRRKLAAVRELWNSRDALARERDVSPGRIMPDSAIVEAAINLPTSVQALVALPGFSGRGSKRHASRWFEAIERARALPDAALPPHTVPGDGPPNPRVWADRDPDAAARLAAARAAVTGLAEELNIPAENLISPDLVRRLCWTPPAPADEERVGLALRAYGARQWQVDQLAAALTEALTAKAE